MGNLNIVTGHTGTNHVSSSDFASYTAGTFGSITRVLNRGNAFSATLNVNTVRVNSGDIILQGHHIRINSGEYVELTINFASAGTKRIDAIVVRYTKNAQTGIEEANLVVVQGNPATGSPYPPALQSGDILDGAALVTEFPLYYVYINGTVIADLSASFSASPSVTDHIINSQNPHNVNYLQVGAAPADHTHVFASVYTGTGGTSDCHIDTIEGKVPKIVHILAESSTDHAILIPSAGGGISNSGTETRINCEHNASTNRLGWWKYGASASALMNTSGVKYHYVIEY